MWTDNLSVGVKYFDEDHKQLIRFINELHAAIQDVDAEGKIAEEEIEFALHRLENYFQYHCIQEEVFMDKIAYPEIDEHRECHKNFLRQVESMSESFRGSRNPQHAAELMQFIYDWLTNHINVVDRKYGDYLRSCPLPSQFLQQPKSSIEERKRFLSALVPLQKKEDSAG
jgi:hemerythrin